MTVTIRVTAQTARVQAQPVQPVTVTPADGARVAVIAKPGPPGPPGSGSGSGFEFVQSTPAATWTITHSLGRYPYSLLVVVDGQQVFPDAEFPNSNTAVLTFAAPVAGRAELS